MSFRERPEYQQWRESVFSLFGRVCIRCGHAGNIHAHHVRPVHLYPELAFDARNGVPLCGNCHAEVKGAELDFLNEFTTLQAGRRGGAPVNAASHIGRDLLEDFKADLLRSRPDRRALKQRAEADPTNTEHVVAYFCALRPHGGVSLDNPSPDQVKEDSKELISFYTAHRAEFGESPDIYLSLADALVQVLHKPDTILEVLNRSHRCAARQWASPDDADVLEACLQEVARLKSQVLCNMGKAKEAYEFLVPLLTQFPENQGLRGQLPELHRRVSVQLANEGSSPSDECLFHAMECAELHPGYAPAYCWVAFLLTAANRFADALRFANKAVEVSAPGKERAEALRAMACVHCGAKLHSDALPYLRKALEIDECDPETLSALAHVNNQLGRAKEAIRFARRCLLYAPENDACKSLVAKLETSETREEGIPKGDD